MEPHKSTHRAGKNAAIQNQLSQFAVVDIETTGGHASKHRIIEIGIAWIDNGKIVDTYETYVNPGIYVPPFITQLTGIKNEDVEHAPTFRDVVKEVSHWLEGRIFVAQNVNFDYSFIKKEFERIGKTFTAKRLCTSRYARSSINGLRKSNLKVLAEYFQVTNENPHRALSDALTAAKILLALMKIDDDLTIAKKLINKKVTKITLPNHTNPADFEKLPAKPGVYFFYGLNGKPIYIGKAKNIKSRVNSHFNGDLSSKRTQAFLREIYSINFHETGSEILAFLLEDTLIKKHWPIYNSAQKARIKKFGVMRYKDQNNNWRLAISPVKQEGSAIRVFYFYSSAIQWLHEVTAAKKLNPKYVGLLASAGDEDLPDKQHNQRIEELTEEYKVKNEKFFIKEKGRKLGETCWIGLENNRVVGYVFSESRIIPNFSSLEPLMQSATTEKIIENYLFKKGKLESLISVQ